MSRASSCRKIIRIHISVYELRTKKNLFSEFYSIGTKSFVHFDINVLDKIDSYVHYTYTTAYSAIFTISEATVTTCTSMWPLEVNKCEKMYFLGTTVSSFKIKTKCGYVCALLYVNIEQLVRLST